ncbi:hypothetical protein BCR33DRAFT_492342 [Rhizoclosmatium globosum]|uniref:Uncharacterized protein n=1 Tax=Rhizoclosmatium globosum TaxID=329046 RepID=A0A1Y2CUQ2_9FUNG|nr:hypothetical protein BCR33DRAFT_492342 [Rhizoclosmatium globosum]|eukprot:ORY50697.1 hypothetical protein BCR33DRAFT_492342 [Rhizoclosmatium globosum]
MDEFFTVAADTDALVAARKPRHVDARLKLRRSARLAATSPTATSPPSTAPHLTQSQAKAHAQAQTLRRGNGESFLDERRRKLEQRNRHVDDVKRAHQSRKSVLDADAEFRLREKSERAEKNRALLIDTQVCAEV